MRTETISEPGFARETDDLLALLGDQPPLDHETVLAGRAEQPDPAYAGVPDARVRIENTSIPVRWGACPARVYTAPGTHPRPLLLWLHGGAFVGGAARDLDAPCAGLAAAGDVVVVSLDYRLAPEHPYPAAVRDVHDTLGWLRTHGDSLGDHSRVAVGGQSAGANLATAACLLGRDQDGSRDDLQVLCYPCLDFGQDTESARAFEGVFLSVAPGSWEEQAYLAGRRVDAHTAPLRARTLVGLPPALVVGAGRDPLRDDAREYAVRLDRDGVAVRYVEYADTMHAFLNFHAVLSASAHAVALIGAHLRTKLPRP